MLWTVTEIGHQLEYRMYFEMDHCLNQNTGHHWYHCWDLHVGIVIVVHVWSLLRVSIYMVLISPA